MSLPGKRFLDVTSSREMAVVVLATITGVYYLIVAVTNCTDTDTNRRGVAEVFAMRRTIHNPGTDWRSMTNGTVALIAYILIVVWEYLIAFVLLAAAANGWWGLGRGRRGAVVISAKLASLGWIMVTLLFVGGFLTIAGEWFRMWANKQVDASSAALQNFLIAAVGLILVHLPERREIFSSSMESGD
ncbi:DUF2165 domain-containing protein [Nocardia jiangxiensis]|uniref:DUF2165 domain-containing protein n=1 Tax=Nocardia jiangxiensis TaxID=282685 RepID=A0ABW6SDR4_9NOCA|nr:DUF2165 domain-containing protein [Nocardia jiangxiensis]